MADDKPEIELVPTGQIKTVNMRVPNCGGTATAHLIHEQGEPLMRLVTDGHNEQRTDIRMPREKAIEWLQGMLDMIKDPHHG